MRVEISEFYILYSKIRRKEAAMAERKKVYVETTVVSDLTSRPSPLVRNLARQLATKEWWDDAQE